MATGTFKFADIEATEMSATLTMTVREWRQMQAALLQSEFGNHAGWFIAHRLLTEMLAQAEQKIWATPTTSGDK